MHSSKPFSRRHTGKQKGTDGSNAVQTVVIVRVSSLTQGVPQRGKFAEWTIIFCPVCVALLSLCSFLLAFLDRHRTIKRRLPASARLVNPWPLAPGGGYDLCGGFFWSLSRFDVSCWPLPFCATRTQNSSPSARSLEPQCAPLFLRCHSPQNALNPERRQLLGGGSSGGSEGFEIVREAP